MVSTVMFPIASINLRKGQLVANPVSDIRKVRDKWAPFIIGCQEGDEYINALDALAPQIGMALAYDRSKKNGGDSLENPVLYDPKQLTLNKLLNTFVHAGKAGQYPSRWITSPQFTWSIDKTPIWYNNTHVNSHIETAGQPNKLPRVALSTAHIEEIATMCEGDAAGKSLSFLGGDFNVDEDIDNKVDFSGFPNATFRRHHIISIYDALKTPATFDTDGHRKIDVIASYTLDGRVHPHSVERLDTSELNTDHSAICAFYSIDMLPPPPPPVPWWQEVPNPLDSVLLKAKLDKSTLTKDEAHAALDPVIAWKLGL